MGARLAPVTLLAGVAAGVGAVAVHQWGWGLVLAAVTTVLLVLATPPGWSTRLTFGLGFALAAGLAAVPRGAGDYLLGATLGGYAVLALAVAVLVAAVATLPRPGVGNSARQAAGVPRHQ